MLYTIKARISRALNNQDKLKHFISCNLLTNVLFYIALLFGFSAINSVVIASIVVFGLDLEFFDKYTKSVSAELEDIAVNTLGIFCAIAVSIAFII